ncbi:hypothetical protein BH23GEM4_BH23GEM4_05610 [soil metagenome]
MKALRQAVVLLPLALALAACTGMQRSGARDETPTTVRVENRATLDMTVYVLRQSQRIRLGQVTANSTATLPIPQYLIFGATSLRFLADPIGSSATPVSQEITVLPGDEVVLTIPPF